MASSSIDIVIIGLAITSSWGNGHATTFRSLTRGLQQRGHRVLFLERDQPWYAAHRDSPRLGYCDAQLYDSLHDLQVRFENRIRQADIVIVGSYVTDGIQVCDWVLQHAHGLRAFYDIDTPVTLGRLRNDSCSYVCARQIPGFDLVLSFTGGPTLQVLENQYDARRAVPLYCSVDAGYYVPLQVSRDIDLGYMGTYSEDRQGGLEELLNTPARRLASRSFLVVGAQYPEQLQWPANVQRTSHLAPAQHIAFYNRQRCTLNLTRADMRRAGYAPSVRLFEAAACGTPIVSDEWPGLAEIFVPDEGIVIARSAGDIVALLEHASDTQLRRMAAAARERVLAMHSSESRAAELEGYIRGTLRDQVRRASLASTANRIPQSGAIV